jgi:RecA/RadA recombinase
MPMDLNKVVKALQKKYTSQKKDASLDIASNIQDPSEYISTGNLALDLSLEGGVAWGYATEFSGLSASGKTLMLQMMLSDAQKKYDAVGIWFDREKAWVNKRAEELGIDISKVILVPPQDIVGVKEAEEMAVDILDKVPKDVYKFIAIDSISAFAKEGDKADMGKKAQSLHNLFRTILPYINSRTSFSFTNQRTFKIGVQFGDPSTVTGGEGPKYYTTYRIKLDNRKEIKDDKKGNEIVGNWIKATVIKTRQGPNYREAVFPFYYKDGIPYYGGYARLLVRRGYCSPSNQKEFNSFNQTTVKYKDEEFNEFKVEEFLEKHPELKFSSYPEYGGDGKEDKGEED